MPPPSTSETPYIAPAGSLAVTHPEDVLRFCEAVRFTGTLAFQADRARGVLPMLNGVPEIAPGNQRLERALDDFLALTSGRYTLTQLLPALEGAAADGELALRGTLESVSLADLLRYCEGSGLTGALTLRHDQRVCVARYDRGELASITVEGEGDGDVSGVFAWAHGTFALKARSVFERDRRPSGPQASNFLRTVELALAEVIEKTDRAATRGPTPRPTTVRQAPSVLRGSTLPFGVEEMRDSRPNISAPARTVNTAVAPPGDETPSVAPPAISSVPASVPASVPPSTKRRSVPAPPNPESTVKIYFVDKGPPLRPSGTQHAAAKLGSEVLPLEPSTSKSVPAVKDSAASAILAARARAPATVRDAVTPRPVSVPPRPAAAAATTATSGAAQPAAKPTQPAARPGPTATSSAAGAASATGVKSTPSATGATSAMSMKSAPSATGAAVKSGGESGGAAAARETKPPTSEGPAKSPSGSRPAVTAPRPAVTASKPLPRPAISLPAVKPAAAVAPSKDEPRAASGAPAASESRPPAPARTEGEAAAASEPRAVETLAELEALVESGRPPADEPPPPPQQRASEPPVAVMSEPPVAVSEPPAAAAAVERAEEAAAPAASEATAASEARARADDAAARERAAAARRAAESLPPLDADEFEAPPISERPGPPTAGGTAGSAGARTRPSRSEMALSAAFGVGFAAAVGAALYVLVTLVR